MRSWGFTVLVKKNIFDKIEIGDIIRIGGIKSVGDWDLGGKHRSRSFCASFWFWSGDHDVLFPESTPMFLE